MSRIGYEKLDEPHYHMHYHIEFHYVCEGSETLLFHEGGLRLVLRPGEVCMIPPGIYHSAFSDSVERICFSLTLDSRGIEKLSLPIEPTVSTEQIPTALLRRYRLLCGSGHMRKLDTETGMLLLGAAMQMLCNDKRNLSEKQKGIGDRRIIIEDYISEKFDDCDGLRGLADRLYLSERRTRSLVREIMGEDFKALIIRERMTVADILIRRAEHSLEEIAVLVGYRSYSGFYTAYRKYHGFPPHKA